jgi:hypothetical protein
MQSTSQQTASHTMIACSETSNASWIAQMDVDFYDSHASSSLSLSLVVYVYRNGGLRSTNAIYSNAGNISSSDSGTKYGGFSAQAGDVIAVVSGANGYVYNNAHVYFRNVHLYRYN